MAYQITSFSTSPFTNARIYSILCDTDADLPATVDGYSVSQGWTAKTVDGKAYIADSSGTWVLQQTGISLDLSGYYTSAETDALLAGKQDALSASQMNAVNSGITASIVNNTTSVLPELVNDGAKNEVNVYGYTYYASDVGVHVDATASMILECSGTCLRDIYIAIKDIQLASGRYVLSGIQETTTSNTYFLSIEGRNGATGAAIDYGSGSEFTAGGGEYRVYLRIKQGINMNDKKIKPMVCTKAEWDISQSFVTYCMTNSELSAKSIKFDTGYNAVQQLINDGAKNKLPVTLASIKTINTAGTWSGNVYTRRGITYTVNSDLTIDVAGTNDGTGDSWLDLYGTGTTSDFIGMICSGCPSGGSATTYGQQCGNANWDYGSADGRVCVQGPIALVVRSGYDASGGLTFKPMICTSDDWSISKTYVPYCPSLYDLYQMVLAYHT